MRSPDNPLHLAFIHRNLFLGNERAGLAVTAGMSATAECRLCVGTSACEDLHSLKPSNSSSIVHHFDNNVSTNFSIRAADTKMSHKNVWNFTIPAAIELAQQLNKDGNVLVHCKKGINRSVATVVFYVIITLIAYDNPDNNKLQSFRPSSSRRLIEVYKRYRRKLGRKRGLKRTVFKVVKELRRLNRERRKLPTLTNPYFKAAIDMAVDQESQAFRHAIMAAIGGNLSTA